MYCYTRGDDRLFQNGVIIILTMLHNLVLEVSPDASDGYHFNVKNDPPMSTGQG